MHGNSIIGIPCSTIKPRWQSSVSHPDHQVIGDYKDYECDSYLQKLVEGKSIAYVCPSPHLVNQEMGEFIDSHDLVVRVNQNFYPKKSTWSDYGRRTDILVNCMNQLKIRALSEDKDYVRSLKFILSAMVSTSERTGIDAYLEATGRPHQNVCDEYLFKVFKEVGTTVNTGLNGIITLLNYPLKSLYVTGMTFFNMNKMGRVYRDDYHDHAARFGNFSDTANREPSEAQLRMDIHAQQPQIDYFQKIVDHYYPDKLKLDSFLVENFTS